MSNVLRRQTGMPAGISTGGGDTGMSVQPQPHLYTVEIHDGQSSVDFVLPAGTRLIETWVLPSITAPPTGGTVTLTDVTNSIVYINAADAEVVNRSALVSAGTLTEQARFRLSQTGIDADSAVRAGFLAIMPGIAA